MQHLDVRWTPPPPMFLTLICFPGRGEQHYGGFIERVHDDDVQQHRPPRKSHLSRKFPLGHASPASPARPLLCQVCSEVYGFLPPLAESLRLNRIRHESGAFLSPRSLHLEKTREKDAKVKERHRRQEKARRAQCRRRRRRERETAGQERTGPEKWDGLGGGSGGEGKGHTGGVEQDKSAGAVSVPDGYSINV